MHGARKIFFVKNAVVVLAFLARREYQGREKLVVVSSIFPALVFSRVWNFRVVDESDAATWMVWVLMPGGGDGLVSLIMYPMPTHGALGVGVMELVASGDWSVFDGIREIFTIPYRLAGGTQGSVNGAIHTAAGLLGDPYLFGHVTVWQG